MTCDRIRKFTKRTKKSVFTDARRILKGMDEGDPHDDLVEAVADYLAEDPEASTRYSRRSSSDRRSTSSG